MTHYQEPVIDAARPVWEISTNQDRWAEIALQLLLDAEVIVINGMLLIDGAQFHPRRPVWGQLRKRLRAAGLAVPRLAR